ncbi:CD1107 family mobile element protein [Porcincola intestinalis]|uniref:DUF4366 domain-containing protein n=1 Tax=Porcincola intestinalis TaxID=2606632 RepID=A0A6L5X2U2_9FIRM|nr:DUF4366 domain-containing protein [Porcincola intestinalis]MSS13817.1 DUF4366 domain-containing protein [Porcincola intestinalis]
MSKKIRTLLAAAVAVMCVVFGSVTPAFAFVDPTWEESTAEPPAEETVAEESPVEEAQSETEQPFSTPGNGELGDEISSGMKDFYTIHTKNNNTFYLVVDHSGNQDNVYMLSLIDENDLSEFLNEAVKEPETEPPVVVVPETTPEPETEVTVTPEPKQKQENNSSRMTLIILAVISVGAAAYYFKIYKPKKQADEYETEGMETGDGLDTENEDESE